MHDLAFTVSKEVTDLGIIIVTARMRGIKNSLLSQEFDSDKTIRLERIRQDWAGKDYKEDPILAGFRKLHTKVGRSNRDYVASPEGLRRLFLERDRFPHINTLVDIYNLASLESGLALGAHDVNRVNGNITLRLTKGDEIFVPLGKVDATPVFPGEYAYVDDQNNIICRMEVLQVEPTKVIETTDDVFMIIQGNENTSLDYVQKTATDVCEQITTYCGGSYEFLHG